ELKIQPGDLVSLVIGPRANHSCDLTDLELVLKSAGENAREWSLTRDVADDVLAGNPHADRFGNKDVWHFYSEPVKSKDAGPVIDAASLCVQAPSVIEVRLPAELMVGVELVTTATLHPATGADGSVQVQVLAAKPQATLLRPDVPILSNDSSKSRKRFEKA